jgi:hypothetical protein
MQKLPYISQVTFKLKKFIMCKKNILEIHFKDKSYQPYKREQWNNMYICLHILLYDNEPFL